MTQQPRRAYDHRIRQQVVLTGNPTLFPELEIPRSTAQTWIRRDPCAVVSLTDGDTEQARLRARLAVLERRTAVLQAVVTLLLALVRISRFKLDGQRLPEGTRKHIILDAVKRAQRNLDLKSALRVLHLSPARYHAWINAHHNCKLDDRTSCPRTKPQRLGLDEVRAIGDMVVSKEYRHMPIRALALHAQRIGRVFAHAVTWGKLIRERGWRRPRRRIYPPKPKLGLQATEPNEAWHIDVSIIRLLDGTRVYLHAIIDNFSRRILAWKVADSLNPLNTCVILAEAAGLIARELDTAVVMDRGVENLNQTVNAVFERGILRRVLAHIDVSFSNSMIEAWWRSLKHHWLYLHTLDSVETVRHLVAFYVTEHNERIPHSAFKGQTPDEMYFGTGSTISEQLAEQRRAARQLRLVRNRRLSCSPCPRSPPEDEAA